MKKALSLLVFTLFFYGQNEPLENLPINKIQLIGSHNSYKQAIDPALFAVFKKRDSVSAGKVDYSHISFSEQLDLGLRNLEIDVYADEKGGKYAHPKGLDWAAGQKPYDLQGVMKNPGFKVLHIQDLDFRTNGYTLQDCLRQLKTWSLSHPKHEPVFITMNAKAEAIGKPGFTVPEEFTGETGDALDTEIIRGIGRNKMITPDDIRGKSPSLEKAVLAQHWPTVKQSAGKFIFILDETGAKRAAYISGHPSLKGRMLFTNSESGTPEAAIIILNDPVKEGARIKDLVKKGYIVRTRADADTKQARENDYSLFDAAKQSGAQIITTDYYQKSTHFKSDYEVHFTGKKFIRKNPLFAN